MHYYEPHANLRYTHRFSELDNWAANLEFPVSGKFHRTPYWDMIGMAAHVAVQCLRRRRIEH
jgi:hypothetical protein